MTSEQMILAGALMVIFGEGAAVLLSRFFCVASAPAWLRQLRGIAVVLVAVAAVRRVEFGADRDLFIGGAWLALGVGCVLIGLHNWHRASRHGGDRCRTEPV